MNNKKNNSKAISSMVLGILSLLTCGVPIIAIVLGIISMVESSKGRDSDKKGLAIAGLVLSILGLVAACISFLVAFLNGATQMLY